MLQQQIYGSLWTPSFVFPLALLKTCFSKHILQIAYISFPTKYQKNSLILPALCISSENALLVHND